MNIYGEGCSDVRAALHISHISWRRVKLSRNNIIKQSAGGNWRLKIARFSWFSLTTSILTYLNTLRMYGGVTSE